MSAPRRPSFTPGARTNVPVPRAPLPPVKRAPLTDHDIAMAQTMGKMMLATWGEFTHRKDALAVLVALPTMTHEEYDELVGIIRGHQEKMSGMERKIREAPTPSCELSQVEVVVALKHLTRLDNDRATKPNERGWSKSTSSTGHWATAMLHIDRPLAIKAGRMILPRHRKQLRKIIPSYGRKS